MKKRKKIEWVVDENGCHNCTSHYIDYHGYPCVRRDGKLTPMSRTLFDVIPDGFVVRHKCDNPRCINPEHLELGTRKQNTQDSIIRGRFKNPPIHIGVNHRLARINPDIVRYMRKSGKNYRQLAKEYKMCPTNTWAILNRKTWKNVSDDFDAPETIDEMIDRVLLFKPELKNLFDRQYDLSI